MLKFFKKGSKIEKLIYLILLIAILVFIGWLATMLLDLTLSRIYFYPL